MSENVLMDTGTEDEPPETQEAPIEDPQDYAANYLLGRQVAHEYHDPVTQMALDSVFQRGMDAMSSDRGPGPHTVARTKPEHYVDVNKLTIDKTGAAVHPDLGQMSKERVAGATAIEADPLVDPSTVTPAAFGSSLYVNLTKRAGKSFIDKVIPSLAKATVSGGVSGAAEYGVGPASEGIAKEMGINPWVFNVALGVTSGITFERFVEDKMADMAIYGAKLTTDAATLVKAIRAGDFSHAGARSIAEAWAKHVGNETGLYVGLKAENLDLDKYWMAKAAVENGQDPEKVRLATGFFQGDDGQWRWELSDKDYRVDVVKLSGMTSGKLEDVVVHPEAYNAYPSLKDVKIEVKDLGPKRNGTYDAATNTITINKLNVENNPDQVRKTMLHEIMHKIQEEEGFTPGTTIDRIKNENPIAYDMEVSRIMDSADEVANAEALAARHGIDVEQVIEATAAYRAYAKWAGEVEARDVVERWLRGDSWKLENMDAARAAWKQYVETAGARTKAGAKNPYSALEIDEFVAKMKDMGYNIRDPKILDAFLRNNFDEVIPQPGLVKLAKEVLWKEPDEDIDGLLNKMVDQIGRMSESRDIPYRNARQYARDLEADLSKSRGLTPEQRTSLEEKHKIMKQVRDENPPPSTQEGFFQKPRDEQRKLMDQWKEDVAAKQDAAIDQQRNLSPEDITKAQENTAALVDGFYAPRKKTLTKMDEDLKPAQVRTLYGMGPGAVAGIGYDEETQQVTFSPEKAIIGMVAGASALSLVGRGNRIKAKQQAKIGVGITTPTSEGRYMRGAFSNQDTADHVAKNLNDTVVKPEWDNVGTVQEALETSRAFTTLKPEIIQDRIKLRWRANEEGMYGNLKMAHPNKAYPRGRNTWDQQGCGREAFARQNGLEQTNACYGGACYAEQIGKMYGTGSISGGQKFSNVLSKEIHEEVNGSIQKIGLEMTQQKYPQFEIIQRTFNGKEKIVIKNRLYQTPSARVSTNLEPANGQDVRLGVDTDGSAWLADPRVMDAMLAANPRTLSVYSSCYFAPPPPHRLSGRTIIDVTVSGWHPLPETMHRLNWAKQARANGWNVILREVTADPAKFDNTTVALYNRLHDSLMKTDFFVMEQPLHMGATHGNPAFGLPGCCKADKAISYTCDQCEVSEGSGKGFLNFWGISEGTAPIGKIMPDQISSDEVIKRAVANKESRMVEDVESPFANMPNPAFRFDLDEIDLPFKDDIVMEKMANINFNKITDEKGIHDAIAQIGQVLEDQGLGVLMRRGVQTFGETKRAAGRPSTLELKELIGREPGGSFNAEEAVRARYFLVASAQNLVDLGVKASSLNATDLDKMAFVKAMNLHGAIQAQVSGMTAEAGRLLNSFKIMAKSTQGITRQVQEILTNLPGGMSVNEIAGAIATMKTPAQVGKFVNKIQHAKTADMVIEAWINALLSGPTTHAVNVGSTALTTMLQIPERWLAGQFARALKHEDSVAIGEASKMAYGMVEGFRDGLRAAWHVLRTGEATDLVNKIETKYPKAITASNIGNLPVFKKFAPELLAEGGLLARAVDLMGEGIRLPTTALQAEDSFFKSIAYRMELRARAYRDAVQTFPDDPTKQAEHIAKILEDPEKNAPDIVLGATDFARYATYTNKLGKVGQGLQSMTSNPVMKVIIPFVRTPTNILKFGVERSPFGIYHVIKSGTNAERDMALARMSLGSMAMISVGLFASMGYITGGGPSDPLLQADLKRQGWQPYSIKVNDQYYSYNRIEPLGMTLGLAADFAEMTGLAEEDYEAMFDDFGDLATAMVASISKNVTSKTWLKGMSAVTMIPSNPEFYGKKWLEGLVGTASPGILATMERAIDPEQRAVWGMMDALKARIPYYSQTLPPKRDFWGQPMTNRITENNGLQALYGALSPVYVSSKVDSPVDKELVRLRIGLPNARKTQTIRDIEVKLSAEEYDQLVVLRNQVPVENGKNLKQSLEALIQTEQYKNKRADVKEDMIKSRVQLATDLAREALYKQSPTVQLYVDQERMRKQQEAMTGQ